jgi:predicted O-methyltransferase YrrM
VTRVRDVIARLHREGSVCAASDGSRHSLFPVAIPETEGHGLARWVRCDRAERTIEVGLGYGMAALHACEALLENGGSELRHVTIDPHQASRFSSCGMQVLEEAGVGHLVELHAAESQVVLPRMLEEGRTFDVAFVDGDHRFDGVFLDVVYLGRLVRPGGIPSRVVRPHEPLLDARGSVGRGRAPPLGRRTDVP